MFRRALLASVFALPYILPAVAQNPTVPTRPAGDSTNAAASTAFVNQALTGSVTGTIIQNLPVIGGPNNTLTQGTRSGNTTLYMNGTGSYTNGDCLSVNGGNVIDAGVACGGTGGMGTVSAGTLGQMAIYPANGTTVAGAPMPCPSLEAFGGGTGVSDNTAALAAVFASEGNAKCAQLGAGTYAFTSSQTFTLTTGQTLTLRGQGSNASYASFTSAHGITVNYTDNTNATTWYGISFLTQGAGTANGITLTNPNVVSDPANTNKTSFTDVAFRGSDGFAATNYWTIDAVSNNVSNINWVDCLFVGSPTLAGTGISVQGLASPTGFAVQFNVTHSTMNYEGTGFKYGTLVQGVTLNQTNITHANYGVLVIALAAQTAQLGIVNSQIQAEQIAIDILSNVTGMMVANNFILMDGTNTGISGAPEEFTVTGNYFQCNVNSGSAGTDFTNLAFGGTITGNTYNTCEFGNVLMAGTGGINVQSNAYVGVAHSNVDSGSGNTIGGGSQ